MFFFISAVPPSPAHRLDYARGINPGWAERHSSVQRVVLCRPPMFSWRCHKTHFYWYSAGWEGWPTLLGGWQSTRQGIKEWERATTVLPSRQLSTTLESDLASENESLWEGSTSPKTNVLQAVAICAFLFLWTSNLKPSHTISGRVAQSLRRGQGETSFQEITRESVVKSSPAFVFGADYSYSLCIHNRAGEQTVNKNWGHALHKETAIKWWRTLLSLKA